MGEHLTLRNVLLLGMMILISSVFSGIYFLGISPLQKEVGHVENALVLERNSLIAVEEMLVEAEEKLITDTTELQRIVPVKPIVDQVILQLTDIESATSSYIEHVELENEGSGLLDSVISEAEQEVEEATKDASAIEEEEDEEEGEERDEEEGEEARESIDPNPSGLLSTLTGINDLLHETIYELRIETYNTRRLLDFIGQLEELERVVVVNGLTFSGEPERVGFEPKEEMDFIISFSTYHLRGHDDLLSDLPEVNHPEPANKTNPMYTN